MFIRLSDDFQNLSDIELRAHDVLIDRIISLHLQRWHVFSLSPAQVLRIRAAIQFGAQNRQVLETLLRKSQDYSSSARAAEMNLVVSPMGSLANRNRVGKEFYVRAEDMAWWLEKEPHLYVENGVNDGKLYEYFAREGLRHLRRDPNLIAVRPCHGGGAPLGEIMERLVGSQIQGVCICDRDCSRSVPPHVANSTAEHAHASLMRIGVVDAFGVGVRNPFFAFHVTDGWGLENYVGPHMLETFFDQHPECIAHRGIFIDAFPAFPRLTVPEMLEWSVINFKDGDQAEVSIAEGMATRYGVVNISADRLALLSRLAIPSNAIVFFRNSSETGRFYQMLSASTKKDLQNAAYFEAISGISKKFATTLAADRNMRFA